MARVPAPEDIGTPSLSGAAPKPFVAAQDINPNAGQIAGLAAGALGAAANVVGHFENEERKRKAHEADLDFTQFMFDSERELVEARAGVEGKGVGFSQAQETRFNERMEEFMGTVPEHAREAMQRRMQKHQLNYRQSAIDLEDQVRTEFVSNQLSTNLDLLAGKMLSDPGNLQTYAGQGKALIDGAELTTRQKRQLKQQWEQKALLNMEIERVRNEEAYRISVAEPTKGGYMQAIADGAKQAGIDPIFMLGMADFESAGTWDPTVKNPQKDQSATGLFQNIDSDWAHLGGTSENRLDAGTQIRLNIKGAVQDAAMIRRITGAKETPGQMYLMHWAGQGRGPKILRAFTNDPNTPVSKVIGSKDWANISAVNRGLVRGVNTVGEFMDKMERTMANRMKKFGGIQARSFKMTPGLGEKATAAVLRQIQVQAREAETEFKAQEKTRLAALKNATSIGIAAGEIGPQDVLELVTSGQVGAAWAPLDGLYKAALSKVETTAGEVAKVQAAETRFRRAALPEDDPNHLPLNPHDKDDVKLNNERFAASHGGVNLFADDGISDDAGAFADDEGTSPAQLARQAAINHTQVAGFAPRSVMTQIQGALHRGNKGEMVRALTLASDIVEANKNAFSVFDKGKDLTKQIADFQTRVQEWGYTPEQAADQMLEMQDPAFEKQREMARNRIKEDKDLIPTLAGGIASDFFEVELAEIGDIDLSEISERQQGEIRQSFEDVLRNEFIATGGNTELAENRAKEVLQRIYGVTSINGDPQIMKFPPGKWHKAVVSEDDDWMRRQLAADLMTDGIEIDDDTHVILAPHALAEQSINAGGPPIYEVWYQDEDGLMQRHAKPFHFSEGQYQNDKTNAAEHRAMASVENMRAGRRSGASVERRTGPNAFEREEAARLAARDVLEAQMVEEKRKLARLRENLGPVRGAHIKPPPEIVDQQRVIAGLETQMGMLGFGRTTLDRAVNGVRNVLRAIAGEPEITIGERVAINESHPEMAALNERHGELFQELVEIMKMEGSSSPRAKELAGELSSLRRQISKVERGAVSN